MGGASSKAARAAGSATRKYPSRIPTPSPATPTTASSKTIPPTAPQPTSSQQPEPPHSTNTLPPNSQSSPPAQPALNDLGPSVHPDPSSNYSQPTSTRTSTINRDSSDPDLALNARMRQLGPVTPNPTFSNSSTFNTTTPSNSALPAASPAGQSFTPSASAPSQSLFPQASNPAVVLLEARQRLAEEAEEEAEDVGRLGKGKKGRKFLEVVSISGVIRAMEEGRDPAVIEEGLGLEKGILRKLGARGVVSTSEWSEDEGVGSER